MICAWALASAESAASRAVAVSVAVGGSYRNAGCRAAVGTGCAHAVVGPAVLAGALA